MSEYATPPSSKKSEGRNAFADNVRSYGDGFAAGWCDAKAEDLHTAARLGGHVCIADLLEHIMRQADCAGWMDLLRKACRKRGVEI